MVIMFPADFIDICSIFAKIPCAVENDPMVFRGPVRLNSKKCLKKVYYDITGFHANKMPFKNCF